MVEPGADDARIATWLAAVNRELARRGLPENTRAALVQKITRDLSIARAQGRSTDELLHEDAESFTTRVLASHRLAADWTPPLSLVLTGLFGAVIGAFVVWFGLYKLVAFQLPQAWLDQLGLVLFIDVLAVAVILACVIAATWISFGPDLPALPPRLAAHSVVAALLAWPVISGYGYTTGYSLSVGVLATEILIGAVFLAAAIVTARRWAIRADLIQRARLYA